VGSALTQQVNLLGSEFELIQKWEKDAKKRECQIDPAWTLDQFENDGQVIRKMRTLRQMLLEVLWGPGASLSESAWAYGLWGLVNGNADAGRVVRGCIRVNEQDYGVAFQKPMSPQAMVDEVFTQLTGHDLACWGRSAQLAEFGLNKKATWRIGLAAMMVRNWVDCIREEPVRRTWKEAERDVQGLLTATTFAEVLNSRVMPGAQLMFRRYQATGNGQEYWREVEELVVEELEGKNGIFYEWPRYRQDPANYRGIYEFGKMAGASEGLKKFNGGRRQPFGRVNFITRARPPVQYASAEEADRHKDEPCAFHIQMLLRNPKNTLTEGQLRERMHPTCACLHRNNPMLRCTLVTGGMEAILARSDMPDGPEKVQRWKEQMQEVRSKLDSRGQANVLMEKEEDTLEYEVDGELVTVLGSAEEPCV
jgi:hypothetical protein